MRAKRKGHALNIEIKDGFGGVLEGTYYSEGAKKELIKRFDKHFTAVLVHEAKRLKKQNFSHAEIQQYIEMLRNLLKPVVKAHAKRAIQNFVSNFDLAIQDAARNLINEAAMQALVQLNNVPILDEASETPIIIVGSDPKDLLKLVSRQTVGSLKKRVGAKRRGQHGKLHQIKDESEFKEKYRNSLREMIERGEKVSNITIAVDLDVSTKTLKEWVKDGKINRDDEVARIKREAK